MGPIIKDAIEREGIGQKEGGVSYAEVEMDSPNIGSLATTYMVSARTC